MNTVISYGQLAAHAIAFNWRGRNIKSTLYYERCLNFQQKEFVFWVNNNCKYSDFLLRYLQEYTTLGTAGGLYHFRDQLLSGQPEGFLVFNGDICCKFPLAEMLEFHKTVCGKPHFTMLATEVGLECHLVVGGGAGRVLLQFKGWCRDMWAIWVVTSIFRRFRLDVGRVFRPNWFTQGYLSVSGICSIVQNGLDWMLKCESSFLWQWSAF